MKRRVLAASAMAVAAVVTLFAVCVAAQSPATPAGEPRFEIVSARPVPDRDRLLPRPIFVRTRPGGRFEARTSLREIIRFAHGLETFARIEADGARSRLLDEWFEIQAQPPDDLADADRETIRLMIRAMLTDRFSLNAEHTALPQAVTVLRRRTPDAVGRGLRPFDAPCTAQRFPRFGPDAAAALDGARTSCFLSLYDGHLVGTGEMSDLASYLSTVAQAPVVDDTGLMGRFQVDVHFEPATLNTRLRVTTDFPGFAEAFRDDLGLSVVRETAQTPALVVRHVEWPTEN